MSGEARGFFGGVLRGEAASIDRGNVVPAGVFEAARRAGLFEVGSVECLLEAVRGAARYSRGFAHVLLVHGSTRLAVGGSGRVYALSVTEPGGGTDVRGNLRTVAEPAGGGVYRVSGVKTFTSNALYATHFAVLASHGGGAAVFLCERQPEIVVEPLELSGFRGSGVARVEYRGAECERITPPGVDGVREALRYINVGRLGYAALALGMADRAVEMIVEAASSKEIFGRRLIDYQGVRWAVAEIAVKRAALESLVARALSGGSIDPELAAAAKILAGELGVEAAWRAVQILGGRGLEMWGEAERMYRDAKVLDIGEGAREVLLDYIAARTVKKTGVS